MTKVTLTRYDRTNFRQAEKFDRRLGSYGTIRYFRSVYRELTAICVWPWKMVSVGVRYLFYKPMDEKMQTWPLRFPAKENPNMEKALFDWPIVLQYDVKAKYRLISRKFSGMKFFQPSVRLTNQNPLAFVSVGQTNQIALFPFVCFFCFVRTFSSQGHTKIALTARRMNFRTIKVFSCERNT